MSAANILAALVEGAIIPVVRASSPEAALQAVEAIANGGIRAAEITMTVPGAVRVLEKLAGRFGGNLLLGAGTVLDPGSAPSVGGGARSSPGGRPEPVFWPARSSSFPPASSRLPLKWPNAIPSRSFPAPSDRKSTRLDSSHLGISY